MAKNFKEVNYTDGKIKWNISPDICKSCGICIEKCPVKCLLFSENDIEYLGMPQVSCDVERCIACRTCEINCPEGAIKIDGKR